MHQCVQECDCVVYLCHVWGCVCQSGVYTYVSGYVEMYMCVSVCAGVYMHDQRVSECMCVSGCTHI